MAVMATDQPSTTIEPRQRLPGNGPSPADEGGFSSEWNEEAQQRVEARRARVQAAAQDGGRNLQHQQQQITAEDIDEDDESKLNNLLMNFIWFSRMYFIFVIVFEGNLSNIPKDH